MASCRYCSYMDLNDVNNYGECYCSYHGKYYDPDSSGCSHNDKESDGKPSSGGCYLTTAMCQILGKEDNCYELNTLRNFREDYMRHTPEGIKLLEEYEIISPPIVTKLLSKNNRKEIANNMLINYINVAIDLIHKKDFEKAINKYKEMVIYVKSI